MLGCYGPWAGCNAHDRCILRWPILLIKGCIVQILDPWLSHERETNEIADFTHLATVVKIASLVFITSQSKPTTNNESKLKNENMNHRSDDNNDNTCIYDDIRVKTSPRLTYAWASPALPDVSSFLKCCGLRYPLEVFKQHFFWQPFFEWWFHFRTELWENAINVVPRFTLDFKQCIIHEYSNLYTGSLLLSLCEVRITLVSKFSSPTIAFLAFWLAKKLRLWANSRSFTSNGK